MGSFYRTARALVTRCRARAVEQLLASEVEQQRCSGVDRLDHGPEGLEPGDQGPRRHIPLDEQVAQPDKEVAENRLVGGEQRGGQELDDEHEILPDAGNPAFAVIGHRREAAREAVECGTAERIGLRAETKCYLVDQHRVAADRRSL